MGITPGKRCVLQEPIRAVRGNASVFYSQRILPEEAAWAYRKLVRPPNVY